MNQSVVQLFEVYISRADLRPASVRFKRMSLRYFLEGFGDMPVSAVTAAIAEDYRILLAKGRSKRTANGHIANFKPFWKWLRRHDLIRINPFEDLKAYRITKTHRKTFTPDELAAIIRVSDL